MPFRSARLSMVAFALLAASPAVAAPGFSFRSNEFQEADRARADADAFVARSFPTGLPLADARARAEAAEMTCRAGRTDGLVCVYSAPVHAPGGVIGDNTWTLRLTQDAQGRLAFARLAYDRASFDTP